MINPEIITTKGLEKALQKQEQIKHQIAEEKRKANAERRKQENSHKYMMGGTIHKYFPECYCFEADEMDEIIMTAFRTPQVLNIIADIKKRASLEISNRAESEVESDETENTENC